MAGGLAGSARVARVQAWVGILASTLALRLAWGRLRGHAATAPAQAPPVAPAGTAAAADGGRGVSAADAQHTSPAGTAPRDCSELLPAELWATVVGLLPSGRDAAHLACTCRLLSGVCDEAWTSGLWQPLVGSDGSVREPASGRGCLQVRPGDDLQAAVNRCRPGGAIMLGPGTYTLADELRIGREVHLFGGGGKAHLLRPGVNFLARCVAPTATLDGLVLLGSGGGVIVTDGGVRLQGCDLRTSTVGIFVNSAANCHARPVITHCRVRSCRSGVHLGSAVAGRCEHCIIADCLFVGIDIWAVQEDLHVAHNTVVDCGSAITLNQLCPAAFALGPGNELRGNRINFVRDQRLPAAAPV